MLGADLPAKFEFFLKFGPACEPGGLGDYVLGGCEAKGIAKTMFGGRVAVAGGFQEGLGLLAQVGEILGTQGRIGGTGIRGTGIGHVRPPFMANRQRMANRKGPRLLPGPKEGPLLNFKIGGQRPFRRRVAADNSDVGDYRVDWGGVKLFLFGG